MLSTFTEMLEIRDTIQSPILMDENEDKTCTHFLIPTNTNILYVYEIKIDDYDEIYSNGEVEPIVILNDVEEDELEEALHSPDIALEDIDYIDDEIIENIDEGVEVISVVWPEKEKKNKLYRYDPNGESVSDGDIVLVPSRDNAKNKDIIRKAAVAHGNHRVEPDTLQHPLKKIIAIVKRKAEDILCGETSER
jgi:chorismate mutase